MKAEALTPTIGRASLQQPNYPEQMPYRMEVTRADNGYMVTGWDGSREFRFVFETMKGALKFIEKNLPVEKK